jgi:DNA repair exonuclease SbcCD ATPase subunit
MESREEVLQMIADLPEEKKIPRLVSWIESRRNRTAEEIQSIKGIVEKNQSEISSELDTIRITTANYLKASESIAKETKREVLSETHVLARNVQEMTKEISKQMSEISTNMARIEGKIEKIALIEVSVKELRDNQKSLESRINEIDRRESEGRGSRAWSDKLIFQVLVVGGSLLVAIIALVFSLIGKK